MRPGPVAVVGLGPGVRLRGWGHGSCRWVEVQDSSGLGDPYAVQAFKLSDLPVVVISPKKIHEGNMVPKNA